MKNLIDLTGQTFGKLYVVRGLTKPEKGREIKYAYTLYECVCNCEDQNIINLKPTFLVKGTRQSCGCGKVLGKITDKLYPGLKINRLTVVKYDLEKHSWEFDCECGNKYYGETSAVLEGSIKSCGCYAREMAAKRGGERFFNMRKYEPQKATAMSIYLREYNDGDLQFEDFYELSQQNCHYCNIPPSNSKHTMRPNRSDYYNENCLFDYNGLDRVNNNLTHNLSNCVPCCFNCNSSKGSMDISIFMERLKKIVSHKIELTFEESRLLANNIDLSLFNDRKKYYSLIRSINWVHGVRYNDGDLNRDLFYQLSQLPCYYCGNYYSNNMNVYKNNKTASSYAKETGNYRYNGLDRIHNNQRGHYYNNIVSCCRFCNSSKRDLSLEDFYSWIDRLKIKYGE